MRTRKRTTAVIGLGLAGVLALAACGGDNGEAPSVGAATTIATTTESTTESSTGTGATTTDPNFSGDDSEEFCNYYKEVDDSDIGDALDDAATREERRSALEDVVDAINQLEEKAPGEIKADVQAVQTAILDLQEIAEKYDYDLGSDNAEATAEAGQVLANTDVTAATDRLEAYTDKVCGVS